MDELTPAALATILGEPKTFLLTRVLRLLGPTRTAAILVETLHLESDGGMQTKDGTRRRTPGGVFLQLAREQMTLG